MTHETLLELHSLTKRPPEVSGKDPTAAATAWSEVLPASARSLLLSADGKVQRLREKAPA